MSTLGNGSNEMTALRLTKTYRVLTHYKRARPAHSIVALEHNWAWWKRHCCAAYGAYWYVVVGPTFAMSNASHVVYPWRHSCYGHWSAAEDPSPWHGWLADYCVDRNQHSDTRHVACMSERTVVKTDLMAVDCQCQLMDGPEHFGDVTYNQGVIRHFITGGCKQEPGGVTHGYTRDLLT